LQQAIERRAFIALQLGLIAHFKTRPEEALLGSDYVAVRREKDSFVTESLLGERSRVLLVGLS